MSTGSSDMVIKKISSFFHHTQKTCTTKQTIDSISERIVKAQCMIFMRYNFISSQAHRRRQKMKKICLNYPRKSRKQKLFPKIFSSWIEMHFSFVPHK